MNMVNLLKAENKELQNANEELEKKNKRLRLDRWGSNMNTIFIQHTTGYGSLWKYKILW